MSLAHTFYLKHPTESAYSPDSGAMGATCMSLQVPTQIGWPQPAVSMVLQNRCNSGTWVKVDFGWLAAELGVVALVVLLGYSIMRKLRKKQTA